MINLSKARKQIIVLYASTLIGVLLGVVSSVINTRNLIPSDYGDVKYVVNFMGLFSGVLLFGYFVSGARLLAISPSAEETKRIKGVLVTILGITALIIILLMFLCGIIHQYILHKECYYLFYWSIPICFATLLLNYINTSSQGDNKIYTIAAARLLPSAIYILIAYPIYRYYGATSTLMLLLMNGLMVVILSILISRDTPSFRNLRDTFHRLNVENKQYGLQVYYGSLANISIPYLAGFTLGLFAVDNTNVGFYVLALSMTMPLQMLPNVIGTTYFKSFASQDKISSRVVRTTFLMTGATLVLFIILIFPVVNFLYDASYQSIALYAAIMASGASFHGLGDVFNRFLGAHGQGKALRNAAFSAGFVSLVGYTIGIYLYGIVGAITTRLLSDFVYFFVMYAYYSRYTRRGRGIVKD